MNEKSIFRFLVFELWSFNLDHLTEITKKIVPEDAQCSEADLCMLWTVLRFLVCEIWSILYSNFVMNWELKTNSEKKNYIKEVLPS